MKIPNGTYRAQAIDSKHGTTKKGGIEIAIGFKLLDEQWAGVSVTGYVYFTDKTDDDRSLESLEACGWNGENVETSPLVGLGSCECSIVIENETYEGKERSKVKHINKAGGAVSNSTPMTTQQAAAFAAKMRSKIAARKAKNGAGADAKSDDTVPF